MNISLDMPIRHMFKSKIHRATVTHADLNYEGSLSIDATLMRAADIIEGEEVHIWCVTSGARLNTYAIAAPANSGIVCCNGAAAHLIKAGAMIIIATFTMTTDAIRPKVVRVDRLNRILNSLPETAGPALALGCA